MLIFNSDKPEYQDLHKSIIRYFAFLHEKAHEGLEKRQLLAWFNFSEVPNNWLGYSLNGNKGSALGWKYADFLYNNIDFAVNTNGISASQHIEKIMLLYSGSGKDRISDLTVNLIKGFLCKYTETFAKEYISPQKCKTFPVERAYFNYETESYVVHDYYLPYIINSDGSSEYVLLTPFDILREGEPSINQKNFFAENERVRASIDNDVLRTYVNNYIAKAVREYEQKQLKNNHKIREKSVERIKQDAFFDLVREYPELYDYYIRMRENDRDAIRSQCKNECQSQIEKLYGNAASIIQLCQRAGYSPSCPQGARDEACQRIRFFKHIIEDCDGYKCLYAGGAPFATENDIQRLFRFVWYGTEYKVDAEANNGRGQTDFIISKGSRDQNIVEFKLASNSTLSHVFEQVRVYEAANCAEGSIIVIFFYNEAEERKALRVVKTAGYESDIGNSVFLIDCRADNKPSGSKRSKS